MSSHKEREEVFAILRWDGFLGSDTAPQGRVTVKEVVRSQALAEAEVVRLNALNEDKGAHYWWQTTRLFPQGQSAGTDVA
jgi:hypothetical protein